MGGWHWVAVWETAVLSDTGRVEEAQVALGRVLEAQPDFADTARVETESWHWANPDCRQVPVKPEPRLHCFVDRTSTIRQGGA